MKKILIFLLLTISVLAIYQYEFGSNTTQKVIYPTDPEGYKQTKAVMDDLNSPMMLFEIGNNRLPTSVGEMNSYFLSDDFKKTRRPAPHTIREKYIDAWG